jgi:hypothetical protein
MIAMLVFIHFYGYIHERPMRSMEHCEAIAQAYNESVNWRGRAIHYCILVGKGWIYTPGVIPP